MISRQRFTIDICPKHVDVVYQHTLMPSTFTLLLGLLH